ncbi:MAG TPA: hypothetical protein VKH20_09920 [Solirubrobacterales bacterium]|nr:hypothetical protein [Solirubrobacterales bacterium]
MPKYAVHFTGEVHTIDRSRLDSFGMPLQSLTSAPTANGVSSGAGNSTVIVAAASKQSAGEMVANALGSRADRFLDWIIEEI